MSSTPESTNSAYQATDPDVLLRRAKLRSTSLQRRRIGLVSGTLALVAALVCGGVIVSQKTPAREQAVTNTSPAAGKVGVVAHLDGAEEIMANVMGAPKASPSALGAVETAEVSFSLRLLTQLEAQAGTGNVLASPSSLATALAMLELGARGDTAKGIAQTLGTAGVSALEQASGWRTLALILQDETSRSSAGLATEPTLDVSNAVWAQKGLPVEPGFVRAIAANFGSGIWETNFATGLSQSIQAINAWTNLKTHGLIKQLFTPGSIGAQTVMVLADAVYFQAHWTQAFYAGSGPFTAASGHTSTLPMLESAPGMDSDQQRKFAYVDTGGYEAVEIPYEGGRMSALAIMPSGSLSQFVGSMTPESLQSIVGSLKMGDVYVQLPQFKVAADNDLGPTLSAMGMANAFGPQADFSGITTSQALNVETVQQRCYLQVTPRGTTAGAATGIGITSSSVMVVPHVIINKPFLWLIRDNATGEILFESMVQNP